MDCSNHALSSELFDSQMLNVILNSLTHVSSIPKPRGRCLNTLIIRGVCKNPMYDFQVLKKGMMKKPNEKNWTMFSHSSGMHRHFLNARWRDTQKKKFTFLTVNVVVFVSFFVFLIAAAIFAGWINCANLLTQNSISASRTPRIKPQYLLNCSSPEVKQTCQTNYPTVHSPAKPKNSHTPTCPNYFRWIHEDLRPWKESGITRDMINKAQRSAHFRLVIVNGKAYVENYRKSIQTRSEFTLWGILQLLRWYPGRLPDLEMIFDCDDRPVVQSKFFRAPDSGPPPLFRYCSDDWSMDIVFPDWSFWGWPETNIKPWGDVLSDIKIGNNKTRWDDRAPYAYWKGNPNVAPGRGDLMRCNVSETYDWNTRLYIQDWNKEAQIGYKQSNLGNQCTHRYKIYIEGWAWSVSEKYILACDSMTLYVTPLYYDFFMRGMVPLEHYWPIRHSSKCPSLKFAVSWGNNHTKKARDIGSAASNFIQEDLKMQYVYDYMFHLLNEYAKLLKFEPVVPPGAVELCSEMMACHADGIWKKFMVDSLVKSPSETSPCVMPQPYNSSELKAFLDSKFNSTRQVEIWEDEYLDSRNKTR